MPYAFVATVATILAASPTTTTSTVTDDPSFRIVDMVVADVDGTVLTYSQLVAEANLVLLETRGPRIARAAQLNRELLRAILQAMVHRELLLGEIRRLQLRPVPAADVERRMIALRRRFDRPDQWERFLVDAGFRDSVDEATGTPAALSARMKAETQVDDFLNIRIRLNIVVTEEHVARCYAAQAEKFGGASLELVAPRIRLQLRQQFESAALSDLLDQLTTRAKIWYDPDFQPKGVVRESVRAAGSGFACPT